VLLIEALALIVSQTMKKLKNTTMTKLSSWMFVYDASTYDIFADMAVEIMDAIDISDDASYHTLIDFLITINALNIVET
jgi:hypothetical protein